MSQPPPRVDSVPPQAMAMFEAEMKARDIDLALYEVRFRESDELFIVYTSYKQKPEGYRGSDPNHPDYSVEILKKDLSVARVSEER